MTVKIYLTIIAFALSQTLFGQKCSTNAGTKTLYTAAPVPFSTPTGYKLVFINHVGRHGARHLTKDPSAVFGYTLLQKADSIGMLTEKGKRLRKILTDLNEEEHKNVKSISEQGRREQEGIADRLYRNDTALFQNNFSYTVQITKEIRTKQTADAFLKELIKHLSKKQSPAYQTNDTVLRFYDLSPAYLSFEENGAWKQDLNAFKKRTLSAEKWNGMAGRFFSPDFSATLSETEKENFITDVQGFLTILPSVQTELSRQGLSIPQDSLEQFFTCKELEAMGKIDRAEDYLVKGPGTDNNGIQVKIAAPLLVEFINAADAFVKHSNTQSRFRFTHAEAISPFAALLQLEGADKPVKSIKRYNDKVWDASKVIPLSANIQWLFYKDEKENYLVRFLLNEKEVHVTGLYTNNFPFYKWDDVRKFYLAKLETLHLGLSDNLFSYLKNIQ